MAIDPQARTTRRTVMTAALGAAGAFAASAIAGAAPVAAVANGNVQIATGVGNTDNDSASETRVNGTTDGLVAFSGVQAGSGTGLYGYTGTGTGVLAVGGSSGNGLDARSSTGVGALGASYTGSGVYGYAGSTVAPTLTGPVAGVVARADDTSKLALRVMGRATFSFSGQATIAANKSSVTVIKPGVSASSLVLATPRTNRAGVYVQSVVPGAGKFTIRLSKKVSGPTGVAYMILG